MRVGIADHYGWAVAVTASDTHDVVDRRRIELVEPGVVTAPVEHECQGLDLPAAEALVGKVRDSAQRAISLAFDEIAAALTAPIVAVCLRVWPPDFPADVATQLRAPYNARADSIMYRQVLAEEAQARGWHAFLYDPNAVEGLAAGVLGARADEVLHGPRARLGPPWAKDHRVALAATIVAAGRS